MNQSVELMPLPLGTQSFPLLRLRNQIYVDKTDLIYSLAAKPEKFFLARPRRFGKSLLVSTFESLFKYGLRDFSGLQIERLWKDKTYNVLVLDFSTLKNSDSVENFEKALVNQIGQTIHKSNLEFDGQSILDFDNWLSKQPMNSLVILIDEYDSPLTYRLNGPEDFHKIQEVLSTFYACIKKNDFCQRFFFMTGITKFHKTSIFSELNNLQDISIDSRYAALLGYTHDEVRKYFDAYLIQAASVLNCSVDTLLEDLTRQYNGFCFDECAKKKVFVPWSLLNFFSKPYRGFQNYWIDSGAKPSTLLQYLKSHFLLNPEEYSNQKSIRIDKLYASSDVDQLTDIGLLTQTGYLTIKNVDWAERIFYVDYPNNEVRRSMAELFVEHALKGKSISDTSASGIYQALTSDSAETVFHKINALFKSIDYTDAKKIDESWVRTILQTVFVSIGLDPKIEIHNFRGRSDLEVKVGNRQWIFELKTCQKGESAETKLNEGIKQVLLRRYGEQYTNMEIIRIVIVYSLTEKMFVKWQQVPSF